MLHKINRAAVSGIALFDQLRPEEVDEMLDLATTRRYPPGEPVFEQGETATRFFVLLNGRLRVTQVTSEGQQVVVRMVNPGDLFGIAKALRRLDYPGTATAVSESLALAWPMQLLDRVPRALPRAGDQRHADHGQPPASRRSSGCASSPPRRWSGASRMRCSASPTSRASPRTAACASISPSPSRTSPR